jgi:hypothetical protein
MWSISGVYLQIPASIGLHTYVFALVTHRVEMLGVSFPSYTGRKKALKLGIPSSVPLSQDLEFFVLCRAGVSRTGMKEHTWESDWFISSRILMSAVSGNQLKASQGHRDLGRRGGNS